MANFWIGLLLGCGIGLVVVLPVTIVIITYIKSLKIKIKCQEEVKAGRFLRPIDNKDFNTEDWGNTIDIEENKKILSQFRKDVFVNKSVPTKKQ